MSGNTNAPWRDEETLRQKYLGEKKSMITIAEELGCDDETVRYWIEKFDIPTRGHGGYVADEPWHDKELLEELYIEDHLSAKKIGDRLGCSDKTIQYWLNEFGIEMRDPNDQPPKPWHDRDRLYEMYIENGMSTCEIGQELGCDASTIGTWLNKHGIPVRGSTPYFTTTKKGYETIEHNHEHVKTVVRIHRLIAFADGKMDVKSFYDSSMSVHHKNNIPWDNRPENLEVLPNSEHARLHAKGYKPKTP